MLYIVLEVKTFWGYPHQVLMGGTPSFWIGVTPSFQMGVPSSADGGYPSDPDGGMPFFLTWGYPLPVQTGGTPFFLMGVPEDTPCQDWMGYPPSTGTGWRYPPVRTGWG